MILITMGGDNILFTKDFSKQNIIKFDRHFVNVYLKFRSIFYGLSGL